MRAGVAAGFTRDAAYLSFQEYFERLRDVPERWGKPMAAVLGALEAQIDLGIGAIGGKDSMSGSFEEGDTEINVPPTLISFAVSTGKVDRVTSPEFKGAGHKVVRIVPKGVRCGRPGSCCRFAQRHIRACREAHRRRLGARCGNAGLWLFRRGALQDVLGQ